jgi:hypothetical protein
VRRLFSLLASLAILASASAARADDDPPKRPVPAYDGRPPPALTVGEGLLWGPRVVFAPLYLVLDYGVRRPVGALATLVERKQLLAFTRDKLENDELQLGLWPIAFVDFGLKPSVGVEAWKRNFLTRRNTLEGHFSTWGPTWVMLGLSDRFDFSANESVALRAEWVHRPDQVFFGLGPRSLQKNRSRYSIDRLDVSPKVTVKFGRSSSFGAKAGVRALWFDDKVCCDGRPLPERVAAGVFAMPPGFERGYTAAYHQLELTLDSREPRPASQTGLRLDVFGEQAIDLRPAAGQHWVRYGGIAGAFFDLNGNARVLGLTLTALFADPLQGQVPFTEQASLGGSSAMRGFLPGRLIDRSALALTLQYEWPVWAWADGIVNAAVGNVFGEHLADFSPKLLRASAGTGLRTSGSAAAPGEFSEFLVGFGTETYEDGLRVTSFRLFFGGTRGF